MMNRRTSPIPTLIAARVRPVRRPPSAAAAPRGRARLRLHNGGATPDVVPDQTVAGGPLASTDLEDARRVAAALRVADSALGEIQARLSALAELMPASDSRRRLSPQAVVSLQVEIDAAIEAVRAIVDGAEYEGRALLKGRWSTAIGESSFPIQRALLIESMSPPSLGSAGVGFLASIRDGAKNSLRGGCLQTVRAIVHAASAQAARQRIAVAAFLEEVLKPVLAASEIAAENARAVENALFDPAFALQMGQVTRADVFLAAAVVSAPPRASAAIDLRLIRE